MNEKAEARFGGMKVGHSAHFEKARFQGPVNFDSAEIKGHFTADGAKFLNKEQTASFNNMKVGQAAIFDHANFQGPLDLSFSSFQFFQFIGLTYQSVDLEGMTYRNIIFGKEKAWKNTLKLLKSSPYNAQPYTQLAAFFQQSGQPDRADETFITGKRRELSPSWRKPATWLPYIFWDLLTGYGRKPFRVFYPALFIVLAGAVCIFDPRYLKLGFLSRWNLVFDLRLPEAFKSGLAFKKRTYILNSFKLFFLRFMMSFDNFIPAINLGLAKKWQPKELSFIKWSSIYLQRISGWILIPIALAAIASQIK